MNYLKKLKELEEYTDDSDHGTSCILVNKNGYNIGASNNLPTGVRTIKERTERPLKYHFIIHSEASVIAKAAALGINTYGSIMYMRWFPCQECAKLIVNAGIKKLYCDPDYTEIERYQFKIAETILKEGGVEILEIEKL